MKWQKFSTFLLCQSLHNKVCLIQYRTEFFKTVLAINFPILVLWWCEKGKKYVRDSMYTDVYLSHLYWLYR